MDAGQDPAALDQLVELVGRHVLRQLQAPGRPALDGPVDVGLPQPLGLDPSRPGLLSARLAVAGVELTQSTQYSSAAGGGYGPDNGVPLVALKTLVVRAYPAVRPGLLDPDAVTGARVTGEVVVSVGNREVYRTGPTRPDGARVGRQSSLDRSLWDVEYTLPPASGPDAVRLRTAYVNAPLNFVVPAFYCRAGRASVSVHLWTVGGGQGASWSDYVWFTAVDAPRVCLVRVNWN